MKLFFCLLLTALPVSAAGYAFDFTPRNTTIRFSLSAQLHTVHGQFALKRGAIRFDTDTGKASGEIVVDVTGAATGNDSRDSKMHNEVLESKKFPEATFALDRIDGRMPNFRAHGILTLHGAPHEMTMDVQTSGPPEQLHATIRFEIPYVAWGMKDPSNFLLRVSKSVEVSIDATGILEKR